MDKINRYLNASIRENTKKSYDAALAHYELQWKGLLPATAENIANYLSDYAEILSVNTLKQRLAAISKWHVEQGFPDPTKAPIVKKVLRGIKIVHPRQEKQAKPLHIDQLYQVVTLIDQQIEHAKNEENTKELLKQTRNKALLLLGFWRGFRGDELTRLQIENIEYQENKGLICYLNRSKTDKMLKGQYFHVPKLEYLCPVQAYLDWLDVSQLYSGAVFRGINRWGQLSENSLHIDSLIPLLRQILIEAQVEFSELYSAHSLRRGFANWAVENGWDIKSIMEYVGWKNINSAIRYIDGHQRFNMIGNQQSIKKLNGT